MFAMPSPHDCYGAPSLTCSRLAGLIEGILIMNMDDARIDPEVRLASLITIALAVLLGTVDAQVLQPAICRDGEVEAIPDLRIGFGASSSLGAGGHVVSDEPLTGPGVDTSNDRAVVVGAPGGAVKIAIRKGDVVSAPDLPAGTTFLAPSREFVDESGERVAVFCTLDLPLEGQRPAIVAGRVGEPLSLVVRRGVNASISLDGGNNVTTLTALRLNSSGRVAFHATILDSTGNPQRAIWWSNAPATFGPVLRTNMHYAGLSQDHQFLNIESAFLLNDEDDIFFGARLAAAGSVTTANDHGLWIRNHTDARVVEVVREGDPVSGFDGFTHGDFFVRLPQLSFSRTRQVAFRGRIAGEGVDGLSDDCFFVGDATTLALVAREGTLAPDRRGQPLEPFYRFGPDDWIGVADNGSALLRAHLDPDDPDVTFQDDDGLWFWDGIELRLVVREGDEVPGFPGNTWSRFDNVCISPNGRAVFAAVSRGPGPLGGGTSWTSVWSTKRPGELECLVKPGDTIEIGGEVRTIRAADLPFAHPNGISNASDGEMVTCNRLNQIVLDLDLLGPVPTCSAVLGLGLPTQSLSQWKTSFFTPEELDDETISGNHIDLDGDSLNLIMEYVTGGDPRVPNPSHVPAILPREDGSGEDSNPAMSLRLSSTLADVAVIVQKSTELGDWVNHYNFSADPSLESPLILEAFDDGGDHLLKLNVSNGAPSPSAAFFRLFVELEGLEGP